MAIRQILPDSDPCLRKVCRPVAQLGPREQEQIQDLLDTLHNSGNGIGLAAPQVGLLKRIFVIDMGEGEAELVFVNPEIVETRGEQCGQEGCLSIPGYYGKVRRPAWLRIRAQDREGQDFEMEAEGLLAVCICHENDHLNGVLFTDHVEGELEHYV